MKKPEIEMRVERDLSSFRTRVSALYDESYLTKALAHDIIFDIRQSIVKAISDEWLKSNASQTLAAIAPGQIEEFVKKEVATRFLDVGRK